MELRLATAADVPAIARVHLDSWRVTYRGLVSESFLQGRTREQTEERWRDFLATTSSETYLVQSGDKTVGILTLGGARDADVNAARTGEIWGLYLLPEHWRKGIGRQVMAEAEHLLKSRDYEVAVLWVLEANDPARRFYEAMGFAVDRASKDVDMGGPIKAVRYRKGL
jgi:ribosomal protein S18 acetylase RimI-like enzyme